MAQKKTAKKVSKSAATPKAAIRPLGDRVLLKEALKDAHQKTESGIFIPSSAEKDSGAKTATVIAVGPGKYDDGVLVPVSVKPGDTVLFQWGEKVVIDGEEYYVVREGEIVGVLSK